MLLYVGGDEDFPLWAIIVIAVVGAIILFVVLIIICCCIAYCIRSRRNYDKQLDSAYREFMRPYNTPYDSKYSDFNTLECALL